MMVYRQDSNYFYQLALLVLVWSGLSACTSPKMLADNHPPPNASEVADYSDLYYWAAHPYKTDPSDSTPDLYRQFEKDSSVDVFFIYPTSYTDEKIVDTNLLNDPAERAKWNASVNDVALNEFTDNSSILNQASAFNKYRVFSPRYRQAHILSFFIPPDYAQPFFDTAYADVVRAFDYYLAHYNQGRPFIIASHSQGSLHAARLIAEKIDSTPLKDKLVAAFIPGMPIPTYIFRNVVPCSSADQTGCISSWRTFRSGFVPAYIQKEDFHAIVVNPLTWNTDTAMAGKELSHGAVLFKFNDPLPQAVSAQIHGNVLWVSKPKFFGSLFYTNKNYHIGDINLFWKDIRDNLDVRVAAYKREKLFTIGSN